MTYYYFSLVFWCSWNFPGPFWIMTKANHPYLFHMFIFIVCSYFCLNALLLEFKFCHIFLIYFVILAWFITSHSKLIIYLYRHLRIYIWFQFYCTSPKGCPMKLFRFCKCCGRCASQIYLRVELWIRLKTLYPKWFWENSTNSCLCCWRAHKASFQIWGLFGWKG